MIAPDYLFIYNNATSTQFIYVNGVLDATNSPRGRYKGTTGDLTIDTNGVCGPAKTWDGCLDRSLIHEYQSDVFFSSATEVLRDATLTVSYSFNNHTLIDDGPLDINGTGNSAQYVSSSRVGPSLSLSNNPSFIQASVLMYLDTDNYPYSVAIWIRPSSTTGGTIIHVSPSSGSVTWSMPMLVFTNTRRIGVQGCSSSGAEIATGPVPPVGLWTHLVFTYSPST
jgi:hypothetical protein